MDDARAPLMTDSYGRTITYLRISVTDRCDLRCRYCMAEKMTFLPRDQVLSLEELAILADAFIARGVRRIRLTGGEPLMRRDITDLVRRIGRHLGRGTLDEVTLTTNATRLDHHAHDLAAAGVARINVSLDSLDPDRFARITRGGDVRKVLSGLRAAHEAGIAVKINMVALRGENEGDIAPMIEFCARHGHDLTLIETMPLGDVEGDRTDRYLSLDTVRERIAAQHALVPSLHRTGGPARYYDLPGHGIRIGFITPMSENFCAGCNRMRLTCEGRVYMCLGHDAHVDFRAALRHGGPGALDAAMDAALARKPLAHDFVIAPGRGPALARHMSVTGG